MKRLLDAGFTALLAFMLGTTAIFLLVPILMTATETGFPGGQREARMVG